MKKLIIAALFFLTTPFFAQDVIIDLDENGDVIIFNARDNKQPLIELSYSAVQLNHEDFSNNDLIKQDGDLQLHLGYTVATDTKIRKIYEEYLFLGYSSSSMSLSSSDGIYSFDVWKVGSNSRISYAIPISSSVDFVPYYAGGMYFYSMGNSSESVAPIAGSPDETIINRTADKKVHFGNTFESGVRFKFNNSISVYGGYSAYVFYPRFMTWKSLGSVIIYQVGLTLLDNFNRRIIKRSNVAGVLVDVILKSAYNYMIYYFQKGDMNWPISTETPFTQEGFTVGFSFNF